MIAPQPRDVRPPVRYARRGCASLPASRDRVCEHRLVSYHLRITRDSRCQEKQWDYLWTDLYTLRAMKTTIRRWRLRNISKRVAIREHHRARVGGCVKI